MVNFRKFLLNIFRLKSNPFDIGQATRCAFLGPSNFPQMKKCEAMKKAAVNNNSTSLSNGF